MKLARYMILALAVGALAACSPQPAPPDPAAGAVPHTAPAPIRVAQTPRICAAGDPTDEKILLEAENLYRGAAASYLIADQAALVPPAAKATIKASLGTAYTALLAGRQAYAVCDAPTLFGKVGAALGLIGKVKALLPAKAP